MTDSAHIFALFYDVPSSWNTLKKGASVVINDAQLRRRIVQVLRLKSGKRIIIFSSQKVFSLEITNLSRIAVDLIIISIHDIQRLQPPLIALCPLLEKDAWERALTWMTVTGVTAIQPLITQKSKRLTFKDNDFERAFRVMIAAAEQSKQFAIPELYHPKKLDELHEILSLCADATKIVLTSSGDSLLSVIQKLKKIHTVFLCVGPEGDLVEEEYKMLKKMGFVCLRLTPTILRSEHALGLGLGIVRSLCN